MQSIKCKISSRQLQTARRDNVNKLEFHFPQKLSGFSVDRICIVIAGSSVLDLELYIIVALLIRGIEWSLRALASMRAARLFLGARAVIKYVLRAASTLKNTDGEQRALRKFSRLTL